MQRRFARALICFASVGALAGSSASAAFYEGFDYPHSASTTGQSLGNGSNVNPSANPLWHDGTTWQTNGNVWTAANIVSPATNNDTDVVSGSLAYTGLPWVPTGNKAAMQALAADFDRIQVDQEYGTGTGGNTVFYSMLIRVADMAGMTNTAAGGGFFTGMQFYPFAPGTNDNMGAPAAGGAAPITIRRASATDPNVGYELGIAFRDAPNSNRIYGATDFTTADTLFAVVKLEMGTIAIGAEDDIATLWVYRDNGTLADLIPLTEPTTASAHAQSVNADDEVTFDYLNVAGLTNLRSITVRGGNTSTPNGLQVDEIRVGNTWGQVVGVPEPTGLALLGIGALTMFRRRSR